MVFVLVALGFKIAAAPFQIWVPDVYQGAPTPITAYLSVGSKAAGFIVLMRVLETFAVLPQIREKALTAIVILAALTLIYGNLAALPQTNLKRLLTAGFFGKFLVFEAAVQRAEAMPSMYWLVGIGVVTVAAGFYYYLKVVRAMYWQEPTENTPISATPVTNATIAVLVALIFFLGVYPQPVFSLLAPSTATVMTAGPGHSRTVLAL